MKELKKAFENITLMKLFEIEVINKKTKKSEYITFDISLQKNTLIAQHVALTVKEEKSKKIAFKKHVLDTCFSIDENLQELYDECQTAILDSEFYTLPE